MAIHCAAYRRYSEFHLAQVAGTLAVVTDWHEYRHPDFQRIKSLLKTPVICRWAKPPFGQSDARARFPLRFDRDEIPAPTPCDPGLQCSFAAVGARVRRSLDMCGRRSEVATSE